MTNSHTGAWHASSVTQKPWRFDNYEDRIRFDVNPPASIPEEDGRRIDRLFLYIVGPPTAKATTPKSCAGSSTNRQVELRNSSFPARIPSFRNRCCQKGTVDPQFKITEAKRYLGKLLFFDPIRTARILPEFGGVLGTRQTASCGSCQVGEAASKAGTLLNFAVGGEGRGYTDAAGNFIPRRRTRPELRILRDTPLFPGDTLVDRLPTLTDIFQFASGTPARGRKLPFPGQLQGRRPA